MTIIFFHGLGSSKKLINYIYNGKKYNKNNFIELLETIDIVFVPDIPYVNIYYYEHKFPIMKTMFKPVKTINYDDLSLDKYITKMYNNLNKKIYKSPYIVIGHSHGIYYACEFAAQFKKDVKCIISLDGSWITNVLNEQRLLTWKNKGKIIPKINNQKTLDVIINKIKNDEDNSNHINMIFDYVRGTHTKYCIKKKFEKLNLPFITFRDFNTDVVSDINKTYNSMVIKENSVLEKYNNHLIYILLDATHEIWLHKKNKNQIITTIKLLHDKFI